MFKTLIAKVILIKGIFYIFAVNFYDTARYYMVQLEKIERSLMDWNVENI